MHVEKISYPVLVSEEVLADAESMRRAYEAWEQATPAEREQQRQDAATRRAAERAAAPPAALTVDALLDKLGWTREYAQHVVQPYCTCSDGYDGWDRCQHARDEEVGP